MAEVWPTPVFPHLHGNRCRDSRIPTTPSARPSLLASNPVLKSCFFGGPLYSRESGSFLPSAEELRATGSFEETRFLWQIS